MSNVYQLSDYKKPVSVSSSLELLQMVRDELQSLHNTLEFMGNICTPLAELYQKLDIVEKCNLTISPETLSSLQWISGELAKIHDTLLQRQEGMFQTLSAISTNVKRADLQVPLCD